MENKPFNPADYKQWQVFEQDGVMMARPLNPYEKTYKDNNQITHYNSTWVLFEKHCDEHQFPILNFPPDVSTVEGRDLELVDVYLTDGGKWTFNRAEIPAIVTPIIEKRLLYTTPEVKEATVESKVKVFTHDLSAYQFFRANAGDKFDGNVYYKGTIDNVVQLMQDYHRTHSLQVEDVVRQVLEYIGKQSVLINTPASYGGLRQRQAMLMVMLPEILNHLNKK